MKSTTTVTIEIEVPITVLWDKRTHGTYENPPEGGEVTAIKWDAAELAALVEKAVWEQHDEIYDDVSTVEADSGPDCEE